MRVLIISTFIFIAVTGCSSPEEKNYEEYEGIWKRIGTIKFENQVAVDTFLFPKDKYRFRRKEVDGARYKIFGDGHSIWFVSRKSIDSLGNILEDYRDSYAKTSYEIRNDSLFEKFNFWADPFNNAPNLPILLKNGYKAKLKIDGDKYVQYSLREDGKVSYGQFYERVDTYNVNPTEFTGAWERVSTVPIRNSEYMDTVPYIAKNESTVGSYLITADNKRIWCFNFENLNEEGIDTNPGSALLSSYSLDDGKISDSLIYGTSSARSNYKRFNNLRVRDYSLNDGLFSLEIRNNDGNGQVAIFKKQ